MLSINLQSRFINKNLICSSCHAKIRFIILNEVECDWGIHTILQCPECGDLFSIDGPCPAFESMMVLEKSNEGILNKEEMSFYESNIHSCNIE